MTAPTPGAGKGGAAAKTNTPDAFATMAGPQRLQLKIGGLSCSFCVASITKAMHRMDGVREANVNLAHEEALIEYEPAKVTPEQLKHTLVDLGYTVRDARKVRTFEEDAEELRRERGNLLTAAAFTAAALVFMIVMWFDLVPMGIIWPWVIWAMPSLALATIFGPGWHILTMAWASIRRGILNQHVLLEFGAFAGFLGGVLGFVYPDFPLQDFFGVAIFITTYHLLSGYVSLRVRTRASQAVRKLLALVPATARVVRDGREEEIPIEQVRPGELVRVRPGESIPVDGVVMEGRSGVNESLVTGESMPAEKEAGGEVIGGSINETGTLLIRVTRVGEESFLNQVARQVGEARALKPGILALVDRILEVYVPAVLGASALALLVWTLGAWLVAGRADWTRAIFAMLAVLVMGYPCALGMATPLAMIRGGGMAAERGILMRSAEAFQVLKDVKRVVLDKTGTITRGKPAVTAVVPLAGQSPEDALRLAAAVEQYSEHPLARAVVDAAERDELRPPAAEQFEAVSGKGVTAVVAGRPVTVGSPAFVASTGVAPEPARAQIETLQSAGNTVVALAEDGRLSALIAIADQIKDDARAAVDAMRAAGLEPVMITGDNARTARAVAQQVGITDHRAEVLPQDKAAAVRELQRQGRRVAMVGDGINDAPALMQADVGIAIGAGTDIAIESADIVLIGDRLGAAVDAYHLGRASYRKTVQNLSLAFAFNGIGVPLAISGIVHPVWAMIAMVASVSAVLANSFGGRLLPRRRRGPAAQLTLHIANMHCEHCLAAIRDAASGLEGVTAVEGDPAAGIVTVTYQEGIAEPDGIREAIIERGFRAA
ncbi:MAG TPA: heavy metal translocating P-type ATPase [Allosphingosinicella sp.]